MEEVGIVIDMGGTTIKIGIAGHDKVFSTTKIPAGSYATLHDKLNTIAEEINRLLADQTYKPIGIGLAFPGIVDVKENQIVSRYIKYTDAAELDLSAWAHQHWGLPIVLENDARAALLGEWKYGAGVNCSDLVLVTLGTGFGSAVMIDNKMLRGRNNLAGNLGGHVTVNLNGTKCNCGNIGCLESECSAWAIDSYVRSLPGFERSEFNTNATISFRTIFEASARGNVLMNEVLQHCLKVWSIGVITLIHAYDPEKVIIAGGIMRSQEIIIPAIKDMIKRHSWINDDAVDVVSASQIESAGLLGMSYLLESTLQPYALKHQGNSK